ncbi:MAG: AAA family ATPase [Spirochaetales bacterium]|nr:AAA family ATPase [Spirochaetales bacterium]
MSSPRQMPPVFGHRERGEEDLESFIASIPVYRPREIQNRLRGRGYVGQDGALKAVALWAYRHVSRLRQIHLGGAARESLPPKNNMLFVGPTGCGKTFLVELLFREVLRLPTVIVDVTAYSETGYVGQDVSTILTRLFYAAGFNPSFTSVGVICLDEFDKIASGQNNAVFAGAGTTKDVSGVGVQRELLKMLESSELPVPAEITHSEYAPRMMISTRDIVFIASGAFSGLKGLIERSGAEHIGFGREPAAGDPERIAVSYTAEEMEVIRYFQSYGFLPELIGRFQRIVPFRALAREELASILRETVLQQYLNEFRLEGITLHVEEAVLERIVERSLRMETGARGIDAAFIRHLEDAAFEAYSREGARRVEIALRDGEVVFAVT